MKHIILLAAGILSFIVAFIFVNTTTPDSVGPLGILLFFALLYFGCIVAIFFVIKTVLRIIKKMAPSFFRSRISSLKLYYYSSALALLPVIFLAMTSIGGVKVFDAILVAIFEMIALFYIKRRF